MAFGSKRWGAVTWLVLWIVACASLANASSAARAPAAPVSHFSAALAHFASGDTAAAVAAFRRVLHASPAHADALSNIGFVLQQGAGTAGGGSVQEDYQAAETYLRRALAVAPAHEAARMNLGVLYGAAGLTAAATDTFRQAVRLRPSTPDPRRR